MENDDENHVSYLYGVCSYGSTFTILWRTCTMQFLKMTFIFQRIEEIFMLLVNIQLYGSLEF